MLSVLRTPKVVTAQHCWELLGLTGWRWMLLVLRTPKVVTAQYCWELLGLTEGARFARLLGGAGCCCWLPYLPLSTHYSLLTTLYPLGFGFSMRSF